MRCKKHTTDLSSIDGVCASCLRERLIKVIAAQEQADAEAQSRAQNRSNSNTNPPSHHSVSPYNNPVAAADVQRPHNKVNKPHLNHSLSDQRFFNSPAIAATSGGCTGGATSSSNKKSKSLIKFSSFSNLFRSNRDADSNHRVSVSVSGETSGEPSGVAGKPTSVTSSPLWISHAPARAAATARQNKSVHVNESSKTAATGGAWRRRCVKDRGMSPVRSSEDDESSDGSSGYVSAESCKQTPMKTPSHATGRRRAGQRSVSEVLFCLSPLVRASPSRLWSMNGKPPVDGGFLGGNRLSAVPNLSNVKSFCANRSRKLADFGRSGPNR